ncbi:DUF1488 domain-containing protein [Paraburkholderia sp. B3]|uniref:DUF1488 domain-containing protein n=1 Tax=Paraburkholderia sp. B3 TaxID=3134791 RepID=UPI003981CA36
MNIRFLPDAPVYRDSNLTVVFAALVDGARVPCAISVEALEDHFGAPPLSRDASMQAFDAGRPRISMYFENRGAFASRLPLNLRSLRLPCHRIPPPRPRAAPANRSSPAWRTASVSSNSNVPRR